MKKTISGFTIVELLIVIVVIAILAAMSIVAYNGIQNRANDTAVQNDLRNLGQKVKEYMVDNTEPPTANQAGLEAIAKVTKGSYDSSIAFSTSLLYCRTATEFGFVARSKSGQSFVMENGVIRKIDTWGGGNDDLACASNSNVGLVFGSSTPGYGYTNLYRNAIWQSWVAG
ncbi:MAG TPA: type II secretion system protein [Candidatus Saccharimonadales bacterium]